MSSKTELLEQQLNWALAQGLDPDSRGYLSDVASNLQRPMSPQTKLAFERGSGSELQDTPSRPAKMKALHSSSALAVNFFDTWVSERPTALQRSFGLDREIVSVAFEAQFPTGLTGIPPNLDVALELSDGFVIGIESKFSEWLGPKSNNKTFFKAKYFPSGPGLWAERGLPESQNLASRMNIGELQFQYLDVPQLLKHALGMATQLVDQFSLYYVYLDWPGKESAVHCDEIALFAELVGEELRFQSLSYQQVLSFLGREQGVDSVYLRYLGSRYCSNAT